MHKYLQIFILSILISTAALGQSELRLTLAPQSCIKINGSTNISKFTLTLPGRFFPGSDYRFLPIITGNSISIGENSLSLYAKNFKSDNHIALNGFRKLVRADEYPYLKIELIKISLSPDCTEKKLKDHIHGDALINITITGVTKQYTLPFSASLFNDNLNADGKLKLTIKDFGLIPPVDMLGLVKTSEWLEIDLKISALLIK